MPHKHKRKRANDRDEDHDLPPSQNARPLPVFSKGQSSSKPQNEQRTRRKKRGSGNGTDDTPRAFRRLMAIAQGKKIRSGLDDGEKPKTNRVQAPQESLRIKPGEDMRSFVARVDANLPVTGLKRKIKTKDGKDEMGIKVKRTLKERKMHKLYEQWRQEERKIQEQKEEELELAAEHELENDTVGALGSTTLQLDAEPASGKKKGKRRRGGKSTPDDDDPWLEIRRKRAEAPPSLHDVAQAPPQLHKVIRKPLQVSGAAVDVANVPKAAGSLRRREELQAARNDVVEAYRKIREHEQAKLDANKKMSS
ncbi:hypothetical protein CDD82_7572 [Ophiocordyceps australis]|uniref:Urease accessory protein UreD n=1 Tax=Ophiocordyceps australis TaxID=1399860 RepID=A0A2C5ZVX1_9HYPO|nr:hypothetical protein CDD82_7572 [Ophiocordyceps australis]